MAVRYDSRTHVLTGPLLAHRLYEVNSRDPLTLLAGPAILTLAALLAIWLPARRAMAMDPNVALRSEQPFRKATGVRPRWS